ncbi:MAG: 16S rRNA (cytidine(1402)-2'-O)-methyltransferase [Bacteroidia bacterium]|nr:16S rRNA (cytidine(1402)-2'-O)-methyltransferase [Bacteroidia bacterium]
MLYLVPTPIGNLKDITYRAIEVLNEVDLILAEDTRQTKKLLDHYNIEKSVQSHHKFNEHQTTSYIISKLKDEISIALVSDGGTPGISDPGYLLVRECLKEDIKVECLPGATALIPALVNSGIPCHNFVFEGFLPVKKGRQTKLQELESEKRTMVFYESPHRLLKTIGHFIEAFGRDRNASVSRELTKIYEETISGTLQEIQEYYLKNTVKGEIVIVIEGKSKKDKK